MERIIQKVTPPARKKAPKLKRVAAYARVSSGREAPLHSLSAQISQYSGMIQKTPGWQYAGVYADEALPDVDKLCPLPPLPEQKEDGAAIVR